MTPTLSVGEFIAIVNQNLERAFPVAQIEGEVSGYRVSQNKWVSFSLKDENEDALLDCWGTVWQIKNPLEDGMKVIIDGRPQLRAQSGRFSIRLDKVTPTGEGALQRAFELLRAKLDQEGLFEAVRKRALPAYPASIGLITSKDSQAYKDFMTILNQRWGGVTTKLAHVQVQGVAAPEQLVAAIDYFNQLPHPVDVVVLVRGGGSLEDLQAFNDESVVRAVASSRTPTIVGVGHEGDISLADMAADMRAATPTDAAKRVVPERAVVGDKVANLVRTLEGNLNLSLSHYERYLHRQILNLTHQIDQPRRRLEAASSRLRQLFTQNRHQLYTQNKLILSLGDSLTRAAKRQLVNNKQTLLALARSLVAVNPGLQLKRGYAIARNGGQVIKSASGLEAGDELVIELAQDSLDTEVKKIHHGK